MNFLIFRVFGNVGGMIPNIERNEQVQEIINNPAPGQPLPMITGVQRRLYAAMEHFCVFLASMFPTWSTEEYIKLVYHGVFKDAIIEAHKPPQEEQEEEEIKDNENIPLDEPKTNLNLDHLNTVEQKEQKEQKEKETVDRENQQYDDINAGKELKKEENKNVVNDEEGAIQIEKGEQLVKETKAITFESNDDDEDDYSQDYKDHSDVEEQEDREYNCHSYEENAEIKSEPDSDNY